MRFTVRPKLGADPVLLRMPQDEVRSILGATHFQGSVIFPDERAPGATYSRDYFLVGVVVDYDFLGQACTIAVESQNELVLNGRQLIGTTGESIARYLRELDPDLRTYDCGVASFALGVCTYSDIPDDDEPPDTVNCFLPESLPYDMTGAYDEGGKDGSERDDGGKEGSERNDGVEDSSDAEEGEMGSDDEDGDKEGNDEDGNDNGSSAEEGEEGNEVDGTETDDEEEEEEDWNHDLIHGDDDDDSGSDGDADDAGRDLIRASAAGDLAKVDRLLAAGVDSHDAALCAASRHGHVDIVQRLLAAGADVHTDGDKPLWTASMRGHLAVVNCLIDGGADVRESGDYALIVACEHGHVAVVDRLLAAGADAEGVNGEPLGKASEFGHVDVVKRLLLAGASPRDYDPEIVDPLRLASEYGHLAVVECLLDAGADVHDRNDLALRVASAFGHLGVVERLLEAGAGINAVNGQPLRRASANGHVGVVQCLLRHGADPARIRWDGLAAAAWPRVVQCVPKASFRGLPEPVQVCWLRHHLRPLLRLRSVLQRARDRLDRPPQGEPLGAGAPTRERLIAHLRTAGRRFAREYWADGLPLFFEGCDLGPVPDEFVFC